MATPSPLGAWKVKRQHSVSAILVGPPTREPLRFQTQTAQQAMMLHRDGGGRRIRDLVSTSADNTFEASLGCMESYLKK